MLLANSSLILVFLFYIYFAYTYVEIHFFKNNPNSIFLIISLISPFNYTKLFFFLKPLSNMHFLPVYKLVTNFVNLQREYTF